jgi:hypothetical protein
MISPQLRHLSSIDLERPHLPADPLDCALRMYVEIGAANLAGADGFHFSVVTSAFLARTLKSTEWGRGTLIVLEFSWEAVEAAIEETIASARGETWEEVAAEINKFIPWEFDNYGEAEPSGV